MSKPSAEAFNQLFDGEPQYCYLCSCHVPAQWQQSKCCQACTGAEADLHTPECRKREEIAWTLHELKY